MPLVMPAPPKQTIGQRLADIEESKRLAAERTALSPKDEAQFAQWVAAHKIADVDAPDSFYDYRGAYKAGVDPVGGHWPDTFKQHGHPTFSVESQYSAGPGDGGTWDENGQFVPAYRPGVQYSLNPELMRR